MASILLISDPLSLDGRPDSVYVRFASTREVHAFARAAGFAPDQVQTWTTNHNGASIASASASGPLRGVIVDVYGRDDQPPAPVLPADVQDALGDVAHGAERPWCGAAAELGGQQPCPCKTPCPPGACAIGATS